MSNPISRCILLYSGGLDSILAYKILQAQQIDVIALKLVTPFFENEGRNKKNRPWEEIARQYDIKYITKDISEEFINIVRSPKYGYGKHLNPCIDCKIFMVKKALETLEEYNADFVATGEVVGQRPMSQRRDTMRIIERDSGAEGIILRPLSALRLKPTLVEEKGLVDRSKLLGISGRGRKDQMSLANSLGIHEYPAPAGGCILADPILSKRIRQLITMYPDITPVEIKVAQTGRMFFLPENAWLVIGRNKADNTRIKELAPQGALLLSAFGIPSPTGILLRCRQEDRQQIIKAAQLLVRYCSRAKMDLLDSALIPVGIFSNEGVLLDQIKITYNHETD